MRWESAKSAIWRGGSRDERGTSTVCKRVGTEEDVQQDEQDQQ